MKTKTTISIMVTGLLMLSNGLMNAQSTSWNITGNSNASASSKLGTINNVPLRLFTGNSVRMHINETSGGTSGFVGIGTVSPATRLHVNGVITATGGNSTNWNLAYNRIGVNATHRVPRWNGNAFVSGSIFDNGNNVGIQTTSPSYPLTLGGSSVVFGIDNGASLAARNTSGDYETYLVPRWTNNVMYLKYGIGGFAIQSGPSATVMFMSPSGSIGIGVSNPAHTLDINGQVRIRHNGVTSGIWYNNSGNAERVFQGMYNNDYYGLYSSSTGWQYFYGMAGFPKFGVGTIALSEMHILHRTGGGAAYGLRIENASSSYWNLYTNAAGPLTFYCNGALKGQIACETGAYTALSDQRFKKNITSLEPVLDRVMQLNAKRYEYITGCSRQSLGFIAQDVDKLFPEIVYLNQSDNGEADYYTMDYSGFGVIAVKAIQELKAEMNKKDDEILQLKSRLDQLESALSSCCISYHPNDKSISNLSSGNSARLEQNTPNPFSEETTIHYYLPSESKGEIKILSLDGQQILTLSINQTGNGEVRISGGAMSAGTYTYTLIVNGKAVESKIMTLTK